MVTVVSTTQTIRRKPMPEKSGRPAIACADADGERIQEGAREPRAGADQSDRSADDLVVAEAAREQHQAGQERQRLLGHADRAAAEREEEHERRQDELAAAARRPRPRRRSARRARRSPENAERAADDEDVEDDRAVAARPRGQARKTSRRTPPGCAGIDPDRRPGRRACAPRPRCAEYSPAGDHVGRRRGHEREAQQDEGVRKRMGSLSRILALRRRRRARSRA